MAGAPALDGEKGFSAIERIWARPTCEINGLWGGYQGEGSKTVLPATAHAKLTCRLVPDMQPAKTAQAVRAHLEKHLPKGVRLTVTPGHGGMPFLTDPHSPAGKAAQEALKVAFGGIEPALCREGGTIPIVSDFREVFGVDTLLLGLAAPDASAHGPDESFPLDHLGAGIRLHTELIPRLMNVLAKPN